MERKITLWGFLQSYLYVGVLYWKRNSNTAHMEIVEFVIQLSFQTDNMTYLVFICILIKRVDKVSRNLAKWNKVLKFESIIRNELFSHFVNVFSTKVKQIAEMIIDHNLSSTEKVIPLSHCVKHYANFKKKFSFFMHINKMRFYATIIRKLE